MKRFVRWAMGILIALVLVFAGGAYVLPGSVAIQRQIEIEAPPEKVFAILGDLRRMNEYSPWADMDPATTYSYAGPDAAVGQKMSWVSARLGNGSMLMTERVASRRVAYDLNFDGSAARASFELSAAGTGTSVTWGFRSDLDNPLERWLGLMFDRWIGTDYEMGLAKLKAVAETP